MASFQPVMLVKIGECSDSPRLKWRTSRNATKKVKRQVLVPGHVQLNILTCCAGCCTNCAHDQLRSRPQIAQPRVRICI